MKKLSIILPIFNECKTGKKTISDVIAKKLESLDKEIIIVESNSTDGTREMVQEFEGTAGVRIIYQEHPRGKGNAVREGLDAVTGEIILIQDADMEYSIDDYEKVLDPILNQETEFVLGSRHKKGSAMRNFKTASHLAPIMNGAHNLFTCLLNISLGVKMTDPFTMYKVFTTNSIKGITFECNRFDFDWELVIKLIKAGYKPVEVPVFYQSRDFSHGKKVSIWKDPPMWIKAWIKFVLFK
jgi:glycosyltransferase involved in cell wall biosynthesis